MPTKIVADCGTGQVQDVELAGAELTAHQALKAPAEQLRQAEEAAASDLAQRRATIIAELQAIRDATGFTAAKGPLLRILVFILRRLGERDS